MLCNKPGSILCWHTECYILLIPRYKPETGWLWLSNHMFILKGINGVEVDSLQTKISLKNCIFPSKSCSQAILPEEFCMSSTQCKSCQRVLCQVHRTASPMKMTAHCLHWQRSGQQRHSYRNAALASFKGQE